MLSRSVLLTVLVLFVSSSLTAQSQPAKKPADKGKPAQAKAVCPAKPAVRVGPIQAVPPEAIARALEQPVSLEFVETPLRDVIEFLQTTAKIPVLIDKKAFDDVGVQSDVPVTINLKGLKLRSALGHILRNLDLTWTIRDEVLVITTPEQADTHLQTRVYEVGDLVAARDEQLRPYNDFEQLFDVITSTVKPTSWDTVGGPGSIAGFEAAGITALVVSQSQAVLEELDRLLEELRAIRKGSAEPPVRARSTGGPGGTQGMGAGAGAWAGGWGGGGGTTTTPGAQPKPAGKSAPGEKN